VWQVISDISRALGHDPGTVLTGAVASKRLFEAVPFYEGLTLDEIGGRGVRWPERETHLAPAWEPAKLDVPDGAPAAGDGALRLGTFRSLWASKEVEVSPALHFLRPQQVVELSPADAEALGIREGDRVEVGSNGTRVRGPVRLRAAIPSGTVFLAEGTSSDPANALTERTVAVTRLAASAPEVSTVGIQATPGIEGRSEMPASAPMPIPPVTGAEKTVGGSTQEGRRS